MKCFIARILDTSETTGRVGRTRIVPLSLAGAAHDSGLYYVVGPDPEDEAALAAWQRENTPFNGLRME